MHILGELTKDERGYLAQRIQASRVEKGDKLLKELGIAKKSSSRKVPESWLDMAEGKKRRTKKRKRKRKTSSKKKPKKSKTEKKR